MRRIETPNDRTYSRLVLNVDDLKELVRIANSVEPAIGIRADNYVIESDNDIDELLSRKRCIKQLSINSPDHRVYLAIYPLSASLYAFSSIEGEVVPLFLRIDAYVRLHESFFTDKFIGIFWTSYLLLSIFTYFARGDV